MEEAHNVVDGVPIVGLGAERGQRHGNAGGCDISEVEVEAVLAEVRLVRRHPLAGAAGELEDAQEAHDACDDDDLVCIHA